MFKRVELWLVVVLVLVLLCSTFAFGVVVRGVARRQDSYGAFGRVVYRVASLPYEAWRELPFLIHGDYYGMAVDDSDRFPGKRGWIFFDAGRESSLDGYLLLSRYDGDAGHSVIELVDLKAGETEYRINLDANVLFADARRNARFADAANWWPDRFLVIHPLALANGDFLIKGFRLPMVKMDACGQPLWVLDDEMFHHSTEQGPDGNFWSPTAVEPQDAEELKSGLKVPGIVKFSAEGRILYHRPLSDVMLKQGLGYMILVSERFDDPFHLNDIQPVFEDGPFWKRGDLFLSIRNMSTVMLFRPSTDKIVWFKRGPWSAQHDVDVINDHTIAVFNNNTYSTRRGVLVHGHNDIVFYDFATDTVSTPYSKALEALDVRTKTEGLFTLLPDGHLFVEETDAGRALFLTREGELAAEYVNRAENGLIYHLGWSRYMDRAAGDRLLAQLKSAKCE